MAIKLSTNNRVILVEQRGTGLSIPKPFDSSTINLQAAVSDINLLLDHLHLKAAIICGHSWGATLAMYFASFFPKRVKSLILIAPAPFLMGAELYQTVGINMNSRWGRSERKQMDSINQKRRKGAFTIDDFKMFKYLTRLTYLSDKEKIDSIMPKIDVPMNMQMLQLIYKDIDKSKLDLRKSLVSFKKPVFLIDGRQDIGSYVCYELRIFYSSFNLLWVQNSGHFPMYEQPELFYKLMSELLNK
jgi:proline iminopeptidase